MLDKKHKDEEDIFVIDATEMREQSEMYHMSDEREEKQAKSPPIIVGAFIGTRTEQLWEFTEVDGITKLIWCKGIVVSVLSNKKR